MNKTIICSNCTSYESFAQMGWSNADQCASFKQRDDTIFANGYEQLFVQIDSAWAVGKLNTEDLMSNTMEITGCERIIFRDKTLDFQFEIGHDQYKDIDTIIVNGIKFKKEC